MASYGQFTQIDLSDTGFLDPRTRDTRYPNREAARFALELSALSYDFEVGPWLEAGWTDISIQADERLMGGVAAPALAERPIYQRMLNEWVPRAARRHISSAGTIRQIRGLVWKSTPMRTGKAITMIRPIGGRRFAVIIGFMGTGKRRMDWEVNFRFSHPEGFHAGFLANTLQFEENSEKITFDQTAALLGLKSLTLKDILEEAKQPDSRFTIFATGHSQGAAILQVWLYRQMQEGLLPGNILGYGFASPSVAAADIQGLPEDFPLFHILNSDDTFTKIGLFRHIGQGYVYEADDSFRKFCYQGQETDEIFMRLLERFRAFTGTQDAILFALAFLQALALRPMEDIQGVLGVLAGGSIAERLILRRDEPVTGLLRLFNRLLRSNYQNAMQEAPREEQIAALAGAIEKEMDEFGAERFARTIFKVLGVPHTLVFRARSLPGLAPYSYMVIRGFEELRPEE